MNMKITYATILLFMTSALISCGDIGADEQRLVATYARVIIEREAGLDSAATARRIDSIITGAGYSAESFANELRSHGESAKELRQFYDSVSAELTRRRSDSTR